MKAFHDGSPNMQTVKAGDGRVDQPEPSTAVVSLSPASPAHFGSKDFKAVAWIEKLLHTCPDEGSELVMFPLIGHYGL